MAERPCAVVVGSLHYDIFVDAPHRPAAGETVTGHAWHPKFGGKGGNQAVAVARAGCASRMVSAIGDDSFGYFILQQLLAAGVDAAHVAQLVGTGSGMSVAISDAEGDYGAVIVSGSNLLIDPAVLASETLWTGARHLVLQNEVPAAINIAAARAARARGIEVVLNAAPVREMAAEFLALVDVIVVNAGEAEALCGLPVTDLASAEAAARTLAPRFPVVLVTSGGDGVAAASGNDIFSEPAHKVDLVSTHGAGDCFIGTFVAVRSRGGDLRQSVAAANRAAADHVSRRN
jgi:ribokinase